MGKTKDSIEILLEIHRRSQKRAEEDSIRTGVPMVVMKRGKIVEVPPKYKYVKVPIKAKKK